MRCDTAEERRNWEMWEVRDWDQNVLEIRSAGSLRGIHRLISCISGWLNYLLQLQLCGLRNVPSFFKGEGIKTKNKS